MVEKFKTNQGQLFDSWAEKYDSWFTDPIGRLVKHYESQLLLDLLKPIAGEHILDVGCGTGIFTRDVLAVKAQITGLDISLPMLSYGMRKLQDTRFHPIVGDLLKLPFEDESFDKTYSITALEFVNDARKAVAELNRVTRRNGTIVVATLNSLSPWAKRRIETAKNDLSIFRTAIFRSPDELAVLVPEKPTVKTAIHFLQSDDPARIPAIEEEGSQNKLNTGAFVAVSWTKRH